MRMFLLKINWLLILVFVSFNCTQGQVLKCNPNSCRNGAKCLTKSDGTHYCRCSDRFVGEYCQYENPCHPAVSQCQNGGTCTFVIKQSRGIEFKCICPFGFTASLCEIPLKNACDTSPCLNHGTCQLTSNNLDQFKCICPAGFEGPRCDRIDHCAPGPCLNFAPCTSTMSGFVCHCPSGMIGVTCNQDIDECANHNPCIRGTCINLPGTYKCKCPEGFTGKNCQSVFIACQPSPCHNRARCVPYEENRKYHCECSPGFTGRHCDVNIDDCSNDVCRNGGICVDEIENYSCKCPHNFKGQFCEFDVDECQVEPGICQNGGTCVNTVGGFHCICVNGWEGSHCEINKDDCKTTVCYNGGTCHDRVASFYCECKPGKTGLLCHLEDACVSDPCHAGAQCSTNPMDGSYVCSCPRGYKGIDCSIDIDECSQGNPCEYGGTCVNIPGSYTCHCAPGFTGAWCEQNVDECLSNPCTNGASCLNDAGYFTCVCLAGFTGTFCEENVDDCALLDVNPCKNGGICTDLIQGYKCTCPPGFTGAHCDVNIDDCRSDSCVHGGKCIDGVNGYTCKCKIGYTGHRCDIFKNDCASNPCQHNGSCRVTDFGYICICKPGYQGINCEHNIDDCSGMPCKNDGTCIDAVDGFHCYCKLPYTGKMCENTLDPCKSSKCRNGAVCKPTLNYKSYTCKCTKGYKGSFCHEDVNECTRFPCKNGGTCKNMQGSYECICAVGFTGSNCEQNMDECQSEPCMHGGKCVDLIAGYKCVCKEGFTGDNCATNIDDCASNPCQNGATCYDHINRYTCSCKTGFSGTNCHKNDKDCSPDLCLNGGTCIDGVNTYQCQCSRGFTGKNCHTRVNVDIYNLTDVYEKDLCRRNQCERKAKNGICDAECNYFPCNFDDGECSAGLRPFENCTVPSYCARVYKDGKCDEICNTEQCLFDGFDCYGTVTPCNSFYKAYCINHFGDGHCDTGCDTAGCGWDGGDCKNSTSTSPAKDLHLSGDVVMILLVEPETFIDQANRFLMSISKLVHANIKIKLTIDGDPMIYKWSSSTGVGNLISVPKGSTVYQTFSTDHPTRLKRSTEQSQVLTGTLIVLTVDVTKCIQQGHRDCFSNVYNVAAYLGAANAKQDLQELGWPLYSAYGQEQHNTEVEEGNNTVFVVVGLLVVIALIFIVAFVLVRKRKIKAPLWFPDDFSTKTIIEPCNKSNCNTYESDIGFNLTPSFTQRRQPDGQELKVEALEDYIGYGGIGDQPPVKRLRSQDNYTTIDGRKWSFTHEAVGKGSLDNITGLSTIGINNVGPDAQTPLHVAAATGHKLENDQQQIVKHLLGQGARLDLKTETFQEPALVTASRTCRVAVVAAMIQHESVDPNDVDVHERTALHHAVANNCLPIVSALVQHPKTNVNAKDSSNVTPLILTAKLTFATVEVADELMKAHASVADADIEGKTALHWAACADGDKLINMLITRGANKDAQDSKEQTPLYLAAREGSKNAVEMLLRHGASKNITDQTDRLPRDIAERKGHFDLVNLLDNSPGATQLTIGMLPGSTATLPISRKKEKPRRTRSFKEPKAKKVPVAKLETIPIGHIISNPHPNDYAAVTSPHVISPMESPYSTGGLPTPSPLYNGGVAQLPQTLSSNESSLNLAQNSTCMLSPYSSASGRSPPNNMPYKSPPHYGIDAMTYCQQNPQMYGHNNQQYCQQQEYGMTTDVYYDYATQSETAIPYQTQNVQNVSAIDQMQSQEQNDYYWPWDQTTVTQGIY